MADVAAPATAARARSLEHGATMLAQLVLADRTYQCLQAECSCILEACFTTVRNVLNVH